MVAIGIERARGREQEGEEAVPVPPLSLLREGTACNILDRTPERRGRRRGVSGRKGGRKKE